MKTSNIPRALAMVLTLGSLLFLSGCADTVSFADAAVREPVGFWYGFWHGLIAPFAFIISWFDSSVAIFAIYNNGGWYDFGFLWGVGAFAVSAKAST